jgi:hypothetical protein
VKERKIQYSIVIEFHSPYRWSFESFFYIWSAIDSVTPAKCVSAIISLGAADGIAAKNDIVEARILEHIMGG